MAQINIRPENGVRLEQLDLHLEDDKKDLRYYVVSRYERAILRILQRHSGGVRYRNGMTAQELQRATKLSMSTVTARLAELGVNGKGLVAVTGKKREKAMRPERRAQAAESRGNSKIRTVYVYDLSEKGLLLVEGLP